MELKGTRKLKSIPYATSKVRIKLLLFPGRDFSLCYVYNFMQSTCSSFKKIAKVFVNNFSNCNVI